MILYKYYPPTTNSLKSLINAGVWCDAYTNMNDPFDSLAIVPRSFTKNQINEFREKANASGENRWKQMARLEDNVITEFINSFRKDFIEKNYFFGSLSETYDNILLWSHYATSHTGFVLAIDFDETNNHIHKVTYQNKLPDFDMDWFFSVKNADEANSAAVAYLLKDFAVKSIDWGYENEWRVCRRTKGYFRFQPDQV